MNQTPQTTISKWTHETNKYLDGVQQDIATFKQLEQTNPILYQQQTAKIRAALCIGIPFVIIMLILIAAGF